jgi:hypothetical protein
MKTQEFISNNIGLKPSKDKTCSSVIQGTDGNFYSYGYHYPLLVELNGYWIRNIEGYSSSTAKHISWAGRYSGFDVNLGYAKDCNDIGEKVINALENEKEYLKEKLGKLNKRAFAQKRDSEERLDEVEKALYYLTR